MWILPHYHFCFLVIINHGLGDIGRLNFDCLLKTSNFFAASIISDVHCVAKLEFPSLIPLDCMRLRFDAILHYSFQIMLADIS